MINYVSDETSSVVIILTAHSLPPLFKPFIKARRSTQVRYSIKLFFFSDLNVFPLTFFPQQLTGTSHNRDSGWKNPAITR